MENKGFVWGIIAVLIGLAAGWLLFAQQSPLTPDPMPIEGKIPVVEQPTPAPQDEPAPTTPEQPVPTGTDSPDVIPTIPDPACAKKPDAGLCKAAFPRFYFDSQTRSCKQFIWGGCGGSVPFETLASCQTACE